MCSRGQTSVISCDVNLIESFRLATDPRPLEFEYFVVQYFTARTSIECPLPTYHVYLNTISLSPKIAFLEAFIVV